MQSLTLPKLTERNKFQEYSQAPAVLLPGKDLPAPIE